MIGYFVSMFYHIFDVFPIDYCFKIQCLPSGVVPMNYFTKDELVVHADFTEAQEKRVYPCRSSTYKRESTAQRDARRLERLPSNPQWDHKGDKCI